MTKPKIKICCIKSIEEANLAIKLEVDIIGLVGPMPSGPGTILPTEAASIVKHVKGAIDTFYLCSKIDIESICREYEQIRSSHIQIVDEVSHTVRRRLKELYPDLIIVQVIHVNDESDLAFAIDAQESADMLLLDSGKSNSDILGGTGETHNWNLSKKIVNEVKVPVFLAGGLNKDNVLVAIDKVNPYGIDLCSSVRTDDRLDQTKLMQFLKKINEN